MQTLKILTAWGAITLTLNGDQVAECALPFLKTTPHKPFTIEKFPESVAIDNFSGRKITTLGSGSTLESNCVAAQRFAAQVQSFFQPLEKTASPDAVSPNIGKLHGTYFQKTVWEALQKIPRGQTRTYGEIAAAIGRPNAARAVGTACGANPIPLFIPCHRVVAKNGLGGFVAGLPWKKLLLKEEGWNGGTME